jgi:hypothetical protein
VLLSLVRVLSSSLSSSGPTSYTPPTAQSEIPSAARFAGLQERLDYECASAPPHVVCRDLPPVLADIVGKHGDCASLRMRLQLVATSSLEAPPGNVAEVLHEAQAALQERCRP